MSNQDYMKIDVKHMNEDEKRVLREVIKAVMERLSVGHQRYGGLHLAGDDRDFAEEAREEAADFMIYSACDVLSNGSQGKKSALVEENERLKAKIDDIRLAVDDIEKDFKRFERLKETQ